MSRKANPKLLKSMSQRAIIDNKLSSALSNEESNPIKYEEIILTPLNRDDFDKKIIDKWLEIKTLSTPQRRTFHSSFIYENYLYIYGGKDISEGKLNDMWRIELSESEDKKWEKIIPNKKLPYLTYHAGVLIDNFYYIIGGQDDSMNQTNNIYKFDLETNNLEKLTFDPKIFPKTEMLSAVYSPETKKIYIFGGFTNSSYTNKIYSFNIESKEIEEVAHTNEVDYEKEEDNDNTVVPYQRGGHTCVIKDEKMYVFGGTAKDGKLLNDLWSFDIQSSRWEKLSPDEVEEKPTTSVRERTDEEVKNSESKQHEEKEEKDDADKDEEKEKTENDVLKNWPQARRGHSMCLIDDKIYVFGGKVGLLTEANDFWVYNISENTFTILHDTMLEQYTEHELKMFQSSYQNDAKDKKPFRLLNKKEMEDRKNPFSINYAGKRSVPRFNLNRSASTTNMKNIFEKEIFANSGFHEIKHSSIFNLDDKGAHLAIANLNAILPFKLGKHSDNKLTGHVPLPRDGQSMNVYENNKLILFGGDRNLFPFNDLYSFNL